MLPDSKKLTDPILKSKFDLFYGRFPNPLNYSVVARAFFVFPK